MAMCGFCPRRPASLAGDDDGVGAGKDEAGPAVIETDEVRRLALGAAHLDNLAVLVRVADRVAVNEDAVADRGLHVRPPLRAERVDVFQAGTPPSVRPDPKGVRWFPPR